MDTFKYYNFSSLNSLYNLLNCSLFSSFSQQDTTTVAMQLPHTLQMVRIISRMRSIPRRMATPSVGRLKAAAVAATTIIPAPGTPAMPLVEIVAR